MVEMPKEFVPETVEAMDEPKTFTGNRGLSIEEPLIFEIGSPETSGVDFEDPLTPTLSPRGEGAGCELIHGAADNSSVPSPRPHPLADAAAEKMPARQGELARRRTG